MLNYLKYVNRSGICQQIVANLLLSPLISSTNISYLYDINEILLKVVDHMYEKFEDKKGVNRSRRSKTDREYNGKNKNDERTNNDLQNTT